MKARSSFMLFAPSKEQLRHEPKTVIINSEDGLPSLQDVCHLTPKRLHDLSGALIASYTTYARHPPDPMTYWSLF